MKITADTITDAQLQALLWSIPRDHYARQWVLDAMTPSTSHPHRQRNAKAQCAELLNEIISIKKESR